VEGVGFRSCHYCCRRPAGSAELGRCGLSENPEFLDCVDRCL
jgi:hypothetical protein